MKSLKNKKRGKVENYLKNFTSNFNTNITYMVIGLGYIIGNVYKFNLLILSFKKNNLLDNVS